MKLTLRDYQHSAVADVRAAYADGCRAPLLTLPTGGGKTVIFSYIAERAGAKGNRVLILVHRRELLRQTSRTLDDFGVSHGMIAAGMTMDHHQQVQIASVQTLVRRLERLRWAPDLIVVDEAHHATGKTTWGNVLAHYPEAKILGVTATPQRLDGQGLGVEAGGIFDRLITGPTVSQLTAAGHLSPAVVFAPRAMVDLSGIHTRAGDYATNEVAEAMDKPTITGDAVAHYRQHCSGEPAIAFCASVAHAEHVAASFQAAGFRAASIDGGMDADLRAQHIEDLGAGRLHVLTSCEIVSEGTDIPIVSAAILLRPTQSLGLYLQQVGRVLRPAPGKRRAVILDHVGNCFRHGLPDDDREWSLEGREKRPAAASDAMPVRQCGECYHVHRPAPVCPRCGYVYPVQSREVEEVEGELEQVDVAEIRRAAKREQARAKSIEDLVELGRARGYKNPHAWARFVWQARMGKRAA